MRDPTGFLKKEYDDLVENGFDWKIQVLESSSGPHATINGKDMIMLCSNNYLNLSNHPKLVENAISAAQKYGAGSGSVRAIAGTMDIHMELEEKIAKFKGTEASLVYQTGFAANAGLVPQLAPGKEDYIISDELNHGSIIDGVRLSKAQKGVYPHNDMAGLEKALQEADKAGADKILVITDGVFSMDGDIALLDKMYPICQEHGAMIYVDDAHGEGVMGPDGRGMSAHYGLEGKIDVEMGTFSKAYGVVGGLVAGSRDLVNYALNKSRTWLLSGSHPPAVTGAQIAAMDVLETEPQHVKNLWDNTKYFKKELQGMGFNTGDSVTPITPVIVWDSHKCKELSERLIKEEDIFALPIVFPMVARDKARIRTMMNAGHTREDLDRALAAFEKIGTSLEII